MKKLNLKQMEMIEGGRMNQRNCLITGLGIMVGVAVGVAGNGGGWAFAAGTFFVAVSGDCF